MRGHPPACRSNRQSDARIAGLQPPEVRLCEAAHFSDKHGLAEACGETGVDDEAPARASATGTSEIGGAAQEAQTSVVVKLIRASAVPATTRIYLYTMADRL